MFISTFDLFKRGIGPSSSHTLGPLNAARAFMDRLRIDAGGGSAQERLRCVLHGSLSATGRGHATDRGILLGLHGYLAEELGSMDLDALSLELHARRAIQLDEARCLVFDPETDLIFDKGPPLPEHPNGMTFEVVDSKGMVRVREHYFSLGGGFITTRSELSGMHSKTAEGTRPVPFPFDSGRAMLNMAETHGRSIAQMKLQNELIFRTQSEVDEGLDRIWVAMRDCMQRGLQAEGILPGGLRVPRRAKAQHDQLLSGTGPWDVSDWLCAYAMAVNEENAAGHAVVTAPTNGAAGVIPAVLSYLLEHRDLPPEQISTFLLTAAAIGGLIKNGSSISGAEVGCQGEVGAASSMAAAGVCAVMGGSPWQVENAAEIALEHHLGMTCDPVRGLVQVPCIERNGMGAVKAWTAARLSMRGSGQHLMSLDNCIAAMRETGRDMSDTYKETSRGGLAVHYTEC